MAYYVAYIIAIFLLIPGIFMSVTPFPGMIYMFVISLIVALFDGFRHITALDIGILGVLAVLVLLADALAGIIGAKMGGAHWSSAIWGLVGLVFGGLLIPVPFLGAVIGMFLGVLVAELHRTRDVRAANKAALGTFWGWVAGTGFKLVASVAFIVLFIAFGLFK